MIEIIDENFIRTGNQNFPVKINGSVYWISRSCAVAGFIFCKTPEGDWYVLANQRGPGTPDFQGYWNCPCGYLDYNEDSKEAIKREVWEETGLSLYSDQFREYSINTDPIKSNHQNITIRYYSILDKNILHWSNFSKDHMEPNEVSDIKWIPIKDINEYPWAFGHRDLILEIYNKRINIPFWKKWLIKLYNKFI